MDADRLRQIIATASGRLDLTEMVQRLASLITEVTASDVCFVHIVDHTRRRLVLSGATPPFDAHAGHIELAVGEGVAGWVAQNASPAVINDKWRDGRYKYIPELRGEDYASLASVPMVARAGHVVGVLNVHSRQPDHFREEDVSILADVATLMADAVEHARLHTLLEERESELERFAEHNLELQEVERQRLAAEIHDGISQRIVSLSYHLCAAADVAPRLPADALAQIQAARALAVDALDEARAVVMGLRPPLLDDLGLGACLRALAAELPAGITSDVEIDDEVRLEGHVETAIYRMAQEMLQNVVKHSGALMVTVSLVSDGRSTRLSVADDGIGFDPEAQPAGPQRPAYGLAGLRARAALLGAALEIRSAPGRGTAVSVTIPPRREG
ncbi:MAG TPA: GAF domain-containing protein [Candidatus Dormibacteraeota bacterium]